MTLFYYAIDGDDIGACLEKHAFSNDVESILALSQEIRGCLKKIRQYLEKHSAEIIFCEGDSILATSQNLIPISVSDLTFDEFSFSAGIGNTCCDATLALKKAKGLGKKRIEII